MRKLIILLMLILLLGCRTKKITKTSTESKEIQKTEIKKATAVVKDSIRQKDTLTNSKKEYQVKEQETEITVKGKVDKDNPLELHNVKNGDTLQTIRISGNADVTITSKNKSSDNKKSESESKTITDKLKDFSQNIVDENNLSERVSAMKNKAKDLQVTDTSTGVYITIIVLGAVAIVMLFIFLYLKKSK